MINHVLQSTTVTLVLKDNNGAWHRLTGGRSASILHEKYVNYRNISPIARQVITEETPVYYRHCHSADLVRAGEGIRKGSLMALPIIRGQRTVGAVSLVSDHESAFDHYAVNLLALAVAGLGEFTWLLGREHKRDNSRRRQQLMRAFIRDSYRELSAQEIFEDVARVVARGVEGDIVRVSTFDRQHRFLNSRALSCKIDKTNLPPSRAPLLLELLPVHARLKDGRRTVVLALSDNQSLMDETEMIHMFGQAVSSVVLVPITHEDRIVGVISVARIKANEYPPFNETDTTFIELAASTASLAIRQASLDKKLLKSQARPKETTDIRTRVKSSLSGIVGSVEMIRSQGGGASESIDKYLGIIDRSARRLSESVNNSA
jgi:transcriptional regulator with GAF, ATPase, and Fis domain